MIPKHSQSMAKVNERIKSLSSKKRLNLATAILAGNISSPNKAKKVADALEFYPE